MNRAAFYDLARQHPFDGRINVSQVKGTEAILDAWEASKLTDNRWLAYMLATAFWETDRTMLPIEEYGHGKGRSYGIPDPKTGKAYYGRGLVQLTWNYNYEKMGKLLGLDLLNNPELALNATIASRIMFIGMGNGIFTGRKLSDYFTPTLTDWFHARRIINGLDQATRIAGYASAFYAAINTASEQSVVTS